MGEFVRLEVAGGVGTIRLDRPKMNALDTVMQEEIRAAADEAAGRDDVRAVIVYGGERVFAAGADIKQMADMSYTDMVDRSAGLQSSLSAVAAIPKPVVAAITGYALGGGLELALCADVRFCADDAKVGQPEILLGIIPGAGGTQRLARLVGPSRAKDIIFTGRFVDAEEALRSAWSTASCPATRCWPGRRVGPRLSPGRRTRCARPSRPSTGAWRSTSSRAGDERLASPACSRPRTVPAAWARSSRRAPARPGSRAATMGAAPRPERSRRPGTTPMARCATTTGRRAYDDKWSISFDQRCIDYALGRFRGRRAAATFGDVLEIGGGTGFFLLNLRRAASWSGRTPRTSPRGWSRPLAQRPPAGHRGRRPPGRRRGAAVRGRLLRPGDRPRGGPSPPRRARGVRGGPPRAAARRAPGDRRRAHLPGRRGGVTAGPATGCAPRHRLPRLRDPVRAAGERDSRRPRAAALEAHVDQHIFDPGELAATASPACATSARSPRS